MIPSGQNPYKMWRLDSVTGRLEALLGLENVPEPYNAPRQLLPVTYWQTGHVDVIRTTTIREKHSMTGEIILPLILDPRYATDIDGLFEWQFAEWLVRTGNTPYGKAGFETWRLTGRQRASDGSPLKDGRSLQGGCFLMT